MGRVFRRGELKQAIAVVLAEVGEAHGYAIMGELKERVGGGWKPSPGAIYPALLALVETGHVRTVDRDGVQVYALTDLGRKATEGTGWGRQWSSLITRADETEQRAAVGSLLDRFAAESPTRRRLAGAAQQEIIASILERAHEEIEQLLEDGGKHG